MIFVDYAADIAQRVAAGSPARVLETAAVTGIVTRKLRDALPAGTRLTATDLNPPMLEVARTKFRAGEQVEFRPADAMALPFADGASTPSSASSASCSFRQGQILFRSFFACSPRRPVMYSASGTRIATIRSAGSHIKSRDDSSLRIRRQFYNVPFSCHQIDPIKELLIAAGFTGINAAVISLDKEIPDIANFARAAVFGNPLIDQVRTRGGVEPELIVDALTQEFRGEFGVGPGRMPLAGDRVFGDEAVTTEFKHRTS